MNGGFESPSPDQQLLVLIMANYKRHKRKVRWHRCTLGKRCHELKFVVGNTIDKLPRRDRVKLPDWRYINKLAL